MNIEDTYLKDSIKKCVDYVMSKNDEDKRRIITGMFKYNDYLINEQLVVKALKDKEKQEWFNNDMFEAYDKEIERLKEENTILKQTMSNNSLLINENAFLKERIDKAIEYIEQHNDYFLLKREVKELLSILKEGEK